MSFNMSVSDTLASWFYSLCEVVSSILEWIINLLPDSSLTSMSTLPEGVQQYIGWVNWFLPITEISVILAGWVGCLLLYYIVSIIMKFFKLVGGGE